MNISPSQKKHLRTLGHNLNVVVMIAGNGLSENVMAELERALTDHELIKVKLAVGDRNIKQAIIKDMCIQTKSVLIQGIGNVALIYRRNPDADPKKSNVAS